MNRSPMIVRIERDETMKEVGIFMIDLLALVTLIAGIYLALAF